jgi:hypothetical protein
MNEEKYIVMWKHSKWLVLSSFFFMIPSIYAFYCKLYYYSILLLCTSVVSVNYWRKPTYSWRRNFNLFFSKISFITFAYNGIINVRFIPYVITGYLLLIVLIYCFYTSGKLSDKKQNNWYIYHFLFHFLVAYEQFIILHSIVMNNCIK